MSTIVQVGFYVAVLCISFGFGIIGYLAGKKSRRADRCVAGVQAASSRNDDNDDEALKFEALLSALRDMTSEVGAHVGEHSERVDKITQSLQSGEANSKEIVAAGELMVSANRQLQTQLAEAKAEIDRQRNELGRSARDAMTDPLTGIPNRRALDHELSMLIAQHRRRSTTFSVIMVDIDHFKRVNDQNGHMVGDKVLKAFARNLTNCFRELDFIGRFGGEEFAVILPRTSLRLAGDAAERARESIANCEDFSTDVILKITASFGVAEIVGNETEMEVAQRADNALYAAKKAGRNQVHFHDGTMSQAYAAVRDREAEAIIAPELTSV